MEDKSNSDAKRVGALFFWMLLLNMGSLAAIFMKFMDPLVAAILIIAIFNLFVYGMKRWGKNLPPVDNQEALKKRGKHLAVGGSILLVALWAVFYLLSAG